MKKLLTSLILLIPFALAAQDGNPTFQEEFSGIIAFNSGKVISLAEAIPADKYDWSPSEGVRNVGEVIAHVTGANYFFAGRLGFPAEDFNPGSLEGMSKEDAIATMKKSYDHIIMATKSIKDGNLADIVELGGQKFSKRSLMFIAMGHVEEHMGQLIAYARSNNIAPPWSVPADE